MVHSLAEHRSIVTIEVYGTNDSLLLDWTPLAFGMESVEEEYAVFAMADNSTRYAFYRFDFTLELGEYFDLAELALYKATTDEPEMQYDLGEVVEEGEIPALIPAEEAIAEEITEEEVIEAAKKAGADYAVDVYPFYGSDVEATLRAGFDIRHGLIGPGVYASHGYERSHIDGVYNALKVLWGYLDL